MTSNDSRTRRDCLRTLATTGAVAGGGLIGVSSASASSRSDSRRSSAVGPDGIEFEAICVDADHDAALFRVENETDRSAHLEWVASPLEEGIFFVDCQTIRVVGDFAEVMVDATFRTDAGIGNVFWEFGPVDGSAVFDIADVDDIPEDSIVADVDAFREGTPVVPGGGDLSRGNPNYDACQEKIFGEVVDSASASTASAPSRSTAGTPSSGDDCDHTQLVVPANETRYFAVSGDGGLVSVDLFADDERIATASSAAADSCSMPLWWWRWRQ